MPDRSSGGLETRGSFVVAGVEQYRGISGSEWRPLRTHAARPEAWRNRAGLPFWPGAATEVDPFLLFATFDLIPAEAKLTAKIVNGMTPEQCAQALGVKISTVRSQLLAIYGKTGAIGQAGLVRLVLSATAI